MEEEHSEEDGRYTLDGVYGDELVDGVYGEEVDETIMAPRAAPTYRPRKERTKDTKRQPTKYDPYFCILPAIQSFSIC